jgi:glycosyltransferase involved in cell wall biosynthesis
VEAFKSLDLQDHDLVIAGKYGWGPDIYAPNIKVLGYVTEEEKYELLANASLFCYPSLYEGFGFPILEAMALGCPVLTSRAGSLAEVGGKAPIYVDPNSVDDIAGEIEYCLNHDMYPRILDGYEQTKKFSWENTAKQVIEAYKELCGF